MERSYEGETFLPKVFLVVTLMNRRLLLFLSSYPHIHSPCYANFERETQGEKKEKERESYKVRANFSWLTNQCKMHFSFPSCYHEKN